MDNYEELCIDAYVEKLRQLQKFGKSNNEDIANILSKKFGYTITFTDICNIFEPSIEEEQIDLKTHLKHFNYE